MSWVPEMDGLEVVRRVRALPTERPPYLIMLSARGEKADIIAGLESGANDYLTKPFDAGELRARIEAGRRMVEMQDALIESKRVLEHEATHDPLTGLLNRRAILDRLHKELVRAARHGDLLALGMCDLDHFKQVNDCYGHRAGDEVLCGVAQILSNAVRGYDSVGRMGGEEFLLIIPMKPAVDYVTVFERLCARVAESRIRTRSGEISVTVSIGAVSAEAESTVDGLLDAADAALYRAKNEGRNRVVYGRRDASGKG